MSNRVLRRWCRPPLWAAVALACGCDRDQPVRSGRLGFDDFVPGYNRYIREWVAEQHTAVTAELAKARAALAGAGEAGRELQAGRVESLERELAKWEFRRQAGDYLSFGTPADLPADLNWENGLDQPEIGDPAATKGGVFRRFIPTFPPTIRPFGGNSNNSFRGDLYDYIEMGLVSLHPDTMKVIPGTANEWAVAGDGRTVYFRLDPAACYSDGVPVRARDYLVGIYLRVSDNIVNPFHKQWFREQYAGFRVYDERTLSVTLPEPRPLAPYWCSVSPAAGHFYQDYGPDYDERYQWRFPPTTGAYEVLPEDIVKGVSITQTRVKDWWARDRKFYRYRFNPDKIVHTVVRDEPKAFELFRAGELDTFFLTRPEYWYEKSEMQPVFDGYVHKATFYNRYPKVPLGLYLNVTRPPLGDRAVRLGIQHAMNWQRVIDVLYRGDYRRLDQFAAGYGRFTESSIKARPFSVEQAREAFRAAGFTGEGPDGILRKADGTRLSVAVTYPRMPQLDRVFSILQEEARRCGMELRLDGLESTVAYLKEMQKQHEMTFGSWLVQPPFPDFHQFLHSSNAFDDKGNPKPQTNNVFCWARADTDRLSEQVRNARTEEELATASRAIQRIIHDEAIFVPGYDAGFVRVGSWRWIRWPASATTRFSPPVVYDPHETFVFWVDDQLRRETIEAMRQGRTFGETVRMFDQYRDWGDQGK
jgi:microcin C transport system substrate-binding protein